MRGLLLVLTLALLAGLGIAIKSKETKDAKNVKKMKYVQWDQVLLFLLL